MEEIVLQMKNITKTFPGVVALAKVNFELRRGEVHVLVGENGAGKSTLLKILSGAHQIEKGQILIDGREVHISNPKEAQSLGIGIIYQELSLLPLLGVAENMFLGRLPHKSQMGLMIDRSKLYKDSQALIDDLRINVNARRQVRGLGVAKQQMIEIAKALTLNANIIAMDEPTSALSEPEIEELFQIINTLKKQGVGIIYVSHRLKEVWKIGDRVTVLKDGTNVGAAKNIEEVNTNSLINMMVGRDLNDMFPKAEVPIGKETLRVESLTRKGVFENVSFNAHRGEIVGIAGLVGAGRTEVAHAIFGADPIDSGKIYIEGREVSIRSPQDAIRHGVGLVPEDRKGKGLVLLMTVKDNITLANIISFSAFRLAIKSKKERKSVSTFIRDLNIRTPNVYQAVLNLSGGNQQKVVLAKWLCSKSRILIMDEPTRGIDVGAKVEVYQLMDELLKEGTTIIMISSELPEILAMSDRIYVMHEGRIAGQLSRKDATEEKIMQFATGGTESSRIGSEK